MGSKLPLIVSGNIFWSLVIVMVWKKVRILKKKLNITFVNPNTEEQIVQAMAGVLAYNLVENNEYITFEYSSIQNSHCMEDKMGIKNF